MGEKGPRRRPTFGHVSGQLQKQVGHGNSARARTRPDNSKSSKPRLYSLAEPQAIVAPGTMVLLTEGALEIWALHGRRKSLRGIVSIVQSSMQPSVLRIILADAR